VIDQLVRFRARLADHPAYGAEHPLLAAQPASAILDDAVRGLSTYHTRPIVSRRGAELQVDDVKLLYYYQNRTAHVPPEAR
jgi:glycerol-3-phosphate O-acyltransferase